MINEEAQLFNILLYYCIQIIKLTFKNNIIVSIRLNSTSLFTKVARSIFKFQLTLTVLFTSVHLSSNCYVYVGKLPAQTH